MTNERLLDELLKTQASAEATYAVLLELLILLVRLGILTKEQIETLPDKARESQNERNSQ